MTVILPHRRQGPEHLTDIGEYVTVFEPPSIPERRPIVNETQFGGLLRTLLAGLGGYVVAKGWFSAEYVNQAIGLLGVIGIAVWSWYTNKTTSMVSAVAAQPEVKKVVMSTQAAAKADPNPKVTAQ